MILQEISTLMLRALTSKSRYFTDFGCSHPGDIILFAFLLLSSINQIIKITQISKSLIKYRSGRLAVLIFFIQIQNIMAVYKYIYSKHIEIYSIYILTCVLLCCQYIP